MPRVLLDEMLTMTTDATINHQLTDDFDRGFVSMVEAYQPGIYSGALRLMRTTHDAEDVSQETFLRAYRALETYDAERISEMKLRAWLWTIAINICRNRWSRAKPTSSLDHAPTPGELDDDPLDTIEWNRRLDVLSTPQRTAVVLRHVADLPVAEIAAITERPEGTVKADISRGLARLRTTIDNEETA